MEKKRNLRKYYIIILGVLVLLLAGFAFIVASRLGQQQLQNVSVDSSNAWCTVQADCSFGTWASCTSCGGGELGCCQVESKNVPVSFPITAISAKANGDTCYMNSECSSNNCLQGICTDSSVTISANLCILASDSSLDQIASNILPELLARAKATPGELVQTSCTSTNKSAGTISIASSAASSACGEVSSRLTALDPGECFFGICTSSGTPAAICKDESGEPATQDQTENVTVDGRVFCQENSTSTLYPIDGATIRLTDSFGQTFDAITDQDGFYTIDETIGSGAYYMKMQLLPNNTLSTGQPFSELSGPTIADCVAQPDACTFVYTSCTPTETPQQSSTPPSAVSGGNQCIDLVESGSDPVANGAGNFVEYALSYQHDATSNPFPSIKLRVGSAATPLGRDANSTSSSLVSPFNIVYDPVETKYTYRFRWEAVNTAGTIPVPAGTYNVRTLLDGTSGTEISTPSACQESITISDTATEEPLFSILKEAAVVCESGGDSVVNYTISVSNIGSASGTIDFLEDTYDTQAYSLSILPVSLNPSYGSINAGKIRWTGDSTQRSFNAGQEKEFKYSLRIPSAQKSSFTTNGLLNQAVVQYDTGSSIDNSSSFDLRTLLTCSTGTIPNTFSGNDARFVLLGMLFMMLSYIAYQKRIGTEAVNRALARAGRTTTKMYTRFIARMPLPYETSTLKDLELKRRKKAK